LQLELKVLERSKTHGGEDFDNYLTCSPHDEATWTANESPTDNWNGNQHMDLTAAGNENDGCHTKWTDSRSVVLD
jgi:hypothetical protein